MLRHAILAVFLTSGPASAVDFVVIGGSETRSEVSPAATVVLPREAWSPTAEPAEIEGAIRKRAFRIGGGAQTTLQILAPLRETLLAAGYESVFACAARTCGGFDFRFQLDLLGEPEMHVDLGDYRYFLAEHPNPSPTDALLISLVVSRDAQAGFVHITEVFPASLEPITVPESAPYPPNFAASDLTEILRTNGHAVLKDLDFGSGESELGGEAYESLETLAKWLLSNSGVSIAIVGHTDAVGSLAANTNLSGRRAQSVLRRLRDTYGVPASQMEADGVGYLAPVASNLTEDGRAANRRVEVILLSDDQ